MYRGVGGGVCTQKRVEGEEQRSRGFREWCVHCYGAAVHASAEEYLLGSGLEGRRAYPADDLGKTDA